MSARFTALQRRLRYLVEKFSNKKEFESNKLRSTSKRSGAVGFIDWLDGSFLIASERGKRVSDRLQRCGHPGQQHGLRMPPRILSMPTSMRRFLVASCLAEVTQQIHSFRASGVISAQRLLAVALDSMALRKSAGSL